MKFSYLSFSVVPSPLNQTAMTVRAYITPSAGQAKCSINFVRFCREVEGPASLGFFPETQQHSSLRYLLEFSFGPCRLPGQGLIA